MRTSIIKVYNRSKGRWESNARVVLEWNGIANLGQTPSHYTDSNGQAVINHASSGMAAVYVNGKQESKFSAPGSHTVEI